MNEPKNTASKKQSRQKPPLSVARIAGEILVGTVTGFVIAVPVSYAILYASSYWFFGAPVDWPERGEWGAFGFLALRVIVLSFLIVYGPAAAVGVYLVGNIGKQTGSFLATVGAGLLGLIFIPLLWPLVFITVPVMVTLGLNLTRRYKVRKKQIESAKSVARIILIVLAVCSIAPVMKHIGYYGLIIPAILFILALVLK